MAGLQPKLNAQLNATESQIQTSVSQKVAETESVFSGASARAEAALTEATNALVAKIQALSAQAKQAVEIAAATADNATAQAQSQVEGAAGLFNARTDAVAKQLQQAKARFCPGCDTGTAAGASQETALGASPTSSNSDSTDLGMSFNLQGFTTAISNKMAEVKEKAEDALQNATASTDNSIAAAETAMGQRVATHMATALNATENATAGLVTEFTAARDRVKTKLTTALGPSHKSAVKENADGQLSPETKARPAVVAGIAGVVCGTVLMALAAFMRKPKATEIPSLLPTVDDHTTTAMTVASL
jgi:hypothetical protein